MNKKRAYMYVGVAAMGLIVTTSAQAMGGQGARGNMGNGGGQRGTQNMIDEDGNGIADGLDDFDGDGIINRDDEDYKPTENRINRPEIVGQKQMIQNRAQIQQQDTDDIASEIQNRVTNRNQNRVANQGIAQEQERLQKGIADDIGVLQKQSGFKRMLMGADRDSVESAEDQLARHDERVAQLKAISETTTDLADKALIDEQIELMESASSRLQKQIVDNSGGFSLFGWVQNLFN